MAETWHRVVQLGFASGGAVCAGALAFSAISWTGVALCAPVGWYLGWRLGGDGRSAVGGC